MVGLGTATQAPGWASGWISLRFTDFFSQLKQLEAEVPSNVELYLRMSSYNMAENKALNMEGLSLEERAIFCESPLYKDFLAQVAKARFQEALEKPSKRAEILEELATSQYLEEAALQEVQIARSLFGSAGPKEKVAFAMKSPDHPSVFSK